MNCLSDSERTCLTCEQHQLPPKNKTSLIVLFLAVCAHKKSLSLSLIEMIESSVNFDLLKAVKRVSSQ